MTICPKCSNILHLHTSGRVCRSCSYEQRYTDEYQAPRETKRSRDTIRPYKTGRFPRAILGLVCF